MTRAKDISKIVTDADLSGTLDVTGTATMGRLTVDGTATSNITSTSTTPLQLNGASIPTLRVNNTGGSVQTDIRSTTSEGLIRTSTNHSLVLGTNQIERMRITSAGNVGIGGSPNNWAGMNRTLELIGSSDVQLAIHANSDSLSDGDRIGEVAFFAGTTNTLPNVATIVGRVSGTDEAKGFLTFHCRDTDTGGLPQERMRITADGNVGIGDNSPDMTTVIAYSDAGTDFNANDFTGGLGIYNTDDTNNTSSAINFKGGSRHDVVRIGAVRTSNSTSTSSNSADFVVSTRHLASSLGERFRITSNGSVGIGTSSPSGRLSVIGSDNASQVYIGGATGTTSRGLRIATGSTGNQTNDIAILDAQSSTYGTLVFQTQSAERMRITSAGTIGFGSIAANNINNTISFTATGDGTHADHFWSFGTHYTSNNPPFYVINESATGVYLTHGGQSWTAHSDERIKENITSLENVLPDIVNIRCVKYNLKGQTATKIGFIAQDWETNFSEVVDENSRQVIESDGSLSFDTESESTAAVKALSYTETIPVLLKAIQELSAKNDALEARIVALETA